MSIRRFLLVVCLLVSAAPLGAQTGHWEGVIKAAEMNVPIEVDLTKNADGTLAGTFSNAMHNIRALPLGDVRADGSNITFAIKLTGGGVFRGTLSADGQSIAGTFAMQDVEMPFELTRKGDAKVEQALTSAAIPKELEGRWRATLVADGISREVGLRLVGSPVIVSSQGLEIPITSIAQKGTAVTLEVKSIDGSFTGTLSASGIAGTWTQGTFSAPLTFTRIDPIEGWAKAAGGRERVAAVRSLYREATIEAGGHSGTIKVWHTADGKYRKEEQVASFSLIETYDGTNAVVQQGAMPPRTLEGAELAVVRSKAYANANAMFFAFFPDRRRGSVAIEGDTIVMKPEGGVDWRVTLDDKTSLPKTMTHQQNGRTVTVTFASYETVDGITLEKEIRRTNGDPRYDAVIRFTKTVFNPQIEKVQFALARP